MHMHWQHVMLCAMLLAAAMSASARPDHFTKVSSVPAWDLEELWNDNIATPLNKAGKTVQDNVITPVADGVKSVVNSDAVQTLVKTLEQAIKAATDLTALEAMAKLGVSNLADIMCGGDSCWSEVCETQKAKDKFTTAPSASNSPTSCNWHAAFIPPRVRQSQIGAKLVS